MRKPARDRVAMSFAENSVKGICSNGPVVIVDAWFKNRKNRSTSWRCSLPIADFKRVSSSCINTTASSPPPAPRPGIVTFRSTFSFTSFASSLSTFVGFPIIACRCAMVTRGGNLRRKFKISAIRVLENPPPRSGTGSNCAVRMWAMASGMVLGSTCLWLEAELC